MTPKSGDRFSERIMLQQKSMIPKGVGPDAPYIPVMPGLVPGIHAFAKK
jgi:hypothetical protein